MKVVMCILILYHFFFFNDTATTEIYTLSLHDALPIYNRDESYDSRFWGFLPRAHIVGKPLILYLRDRKSTRLNSSHSQISYAVFCLKKKKFQQIHYFTISNLLAHCVISDHL